MDTKITLSLITLVTCNILQSASSPNSGPPRKHTNTHIEIYAPESDPEESDYDGDFEDSDFEVVPETDFEDSNDAAGKLTELIRIDALKKLEEAPRLTLEIARSNIQDAIHPLCESIEQKDRECLEKITLCLKKHSNFKDFLRVRTKQLITQACAFNSEDCLRYILENMDGKEHEDLLTLKEKYPLITTALARPTKKPRTK